MGQGAWGLPAGLAHVLLLPVRVVELQCRRSADNNSPNPKQKFSCPARLKVVHRGNDNRHSEIWAVHEHNHDEENDCSVVFTQKVREKMNKECAAGKAPSDIRVAMSDDLFDGQDDHPQLPSIEQVQPACPSVYVLLCWRLLLFCCCLLLFCCCSLLFCCC